MSECVWNHRTLSFASRIVVSNMLPSRFLLSKLGFSPAITPSVTLQASAELHQSRIVPNAITAFGCTELVSKWAKLHLFNS